MNNEKDIEDKINETMKQISDFASSLTGKRIDYKIEKGHDTRILTHNDNSRRVYMFFCKGEANEHAAESFVYNPDKEFVALKIGKAGANSDPRYLYHHYRTGSAKSSLARSMSIDDEMSNIFKNSGLRFGQWIKNNTFRINVVLKDDCPEFAMELIESVFHFLFRPIYEGNRE